MKLYTLSLVLMAVIGCDDLDESVPPPLPIATLLSVPETVAVEGQEIALTTSLWRDFMPITPPDGSPLQGVCFIHSLDSTRLPSSLSMDAVWIVHYQQVWSAWLSEDYGPDPDGMRFGRIFRNGPKWGPGTTVEVIVRLNNRRGTTTLLRASNQPIGATS